MPQGEKTGKASLSDPGGNETHSRRLGPDAALVNAPSKSEEG